MTEPICEDEGLIQEWTPLTQLLQQIPLKTQRGLFYKNLGLTCLDVVPEFIVLGTNLGFLYWYCRASGDLQRLRFENHHCCATCVKIMPFVDYMIAAGTDQGSVIIIQIPKTHPTCTPDQRKNKQRQMERFTVNGLHQAPVTSIEWDSNDMRVFSGDKSGRVIITEINLSLHISKSMELLNEQFEIVQLSYKENILLISTVFRSIICDGCKNWKVLQVGRKERKILGKFGATFCQFPHGLVLFASRPGHRLWLSDKNGIVQQTLIFKSALQCNGPKVQLINPIVRKEPYDTSFGAVSVVSLLNGARKIMDLAVNENEIFILEGERSLLRISAFPDKYSADLIYQPVSRRTSFNLDEFAAKLKDTAVESIKKITKDLISNDELASQSSPPALADEALELPPVVTLPAGLMPALFTEKNTEIHTLSNNSLNSSCPSNLVKHFPFSTNDNYNKDLFEEVITRPLRKRHNKKAKPSQNLKGSMLVLERESDTTSSASEDRLICGIANDLSLSDESAYNDSQSSFSLLRDFSSIIGPQKTNYKNYEAENEEIMKTSDTKSQTSLDTCESVSERLLFTSEPSRAEQERTFIPVAKHSLFNSCNSEKTDMSISLNMTTSSCASSKISENLLSHSYTSENSEMSSRAKSIWSQNTDNFEGELQCTSKGHWKWNNLKGTCSQEENMKTSSESSVSNRNFQKEFYPKCPDEKKGERSSKGESIGTSADLPFKKLQAFDGMTFSSTESCSCQLDSSENKLNGLHDTENEILRPVQDSRFPSSDNECCSFDDSKHFNNSHLFSDSENFLISVEPEKKDEDKNAHEFKAKPFDETLSYGPPSGSSMMSSQPSSCFFSVPITQHISLPLAQDSFDHWPQHKTPEKITSLATCCNYVVCTDHKDRVYYSLLSGLGLSWTRLDYKASMVRVTSDGSVVWLQYKKTVSALVKNSVNSPVSDLFEGIVQNIKTFAIDSINKEGVFVTLTEKILTRIDGMEGLCEKEIECDYKIADIACSGGVILAVSSDHTVLCKVPEEDQFKIIKTLRPTTSIALGPENLLWVVDEANNIFFSDDFMNDEPHWWQIQISDYIFRNPSKSFQKICYKMKFNELKANSLISTNENSVWIYNKFDSTVYVNKTGFTGYMWNEVSSVNLGIQWQTLCAKGVVKDKGQIWLLSEDGNIFCTTPNYKYFQSVPAPCSENIICVASSVDIFWVLSESGAIYSRLGLSSNTFGTSWKEMKSLTIDNLRLIWISCGSDVAWACDIHGRTFISIGSHQIPALDPVWIEVEGRPKNVQFEKVFVGSELYMVWAIDSNRNLYVREGIFSHYQIGTSWVYVCGIEAVHVTISGTHVWALTSNGHIYRRCGVSESNCIGDYWRSIPGSLKVISSSLENELWGLGQENKILQLRYKLIILGEEKINSRHKESTSLKEDFSWEIVK